MCTLSPNCIKSLRRNTRLGSGTTARFLALETAQPGRLPLLTKMMGVRASFGDPNEKGHPVVNTPIRRTHACEQRDG